MNKLINLKALKHARQKKNITLEQMAFALGMKTPAGYYLIESGQRRLLAEHIPIISKQIGMSPEELSRLLFSGIDLTKCKTESEAV